MNDLENEGDRKNILLSSFRKKQQVDVTGLEENKMAARSGPCKDIWYGDIFFSLIRKS